MQTLFIKKLILLFFFFGIANDDIGQGDCFAGTFYLIRICTRIYTRK